MHISILEDNQLSFKPAVSNRLAEIADFLHTTGVEAYLVGGFVRDLFLKRQTADIDIAVAGDALDTAATVSARFGARYVELDSLNHTARVVFQEASDSVKLRWDFDFSTIRGNIREDLSQRDFTVNAMALPFKRLPVDGWEDYARTNLVDPLAGLDDLGSHTIRATGNEALRADPARLLRAVRLAAELHFTIDRRTSAMIKENAPMISGVAGERVREELLRIFNAPSSGRFVRVLDHLGLLTAIIPELSAAKGVEQPVVHYWDVFEHSVQTVAAAGCLLRQGGYDYAGAPALASVVWTPQLEAHFNEEIAYGGTRASILKTAALLHDIAKPQTKFVDEDGRTRFFGHSLEGASVASTIMERLRFSAREIKLVDTMIRNHLRPGQMSRDELPTPRAIYRFFRDTGEAGIDVLFLSLADHLAARGPALDLAEWEGHTRLVAYILDQYFSARRELSTVKLINGHDLIEVFGIQPGPDLGRILEAVREAQAAGEIATREAALKYAEKLIGSQTTS